MKQQPTVQHVPRWMRVLAWIFGVVMLAVSLRLLYRSIVSYHADGDETWFGMVSFVVLAALVGTVGVQLLVVGVTGASTGPVQRWLSAIRDALAQI
jgi:threonine/homoserine/homoserine lactone efflux protein